MKHITVFKVILAAILICTSCERKPEDYTLAVVGIYNGTLTSGGSITTRNYDVRIVGTDKFNGVNLYSFDIEGLDVDCRISRTDSGYALSPENLNIYSIKVIGDQLTFSFNNQNDGVTKFSGSKY